MKTYTVRYSVQSSGAGRFTTSFKIRAAGPFAAKSIAKRQLAKNIGDPRLISITEEG